MNQVKTSYIYLIAGTGMLLHLSTIYCILPFFISRGALLTQMMLLILQQMLFINYGRWIKALKDCKALKYFCRFLCAMHVSIICGMKNPKSRNKTNCFIYRTKQQKMLP